MKLNYKIQLILVALVSVMVTVAVLHINGFLRHSVEQDALYIAEFSLIASMPGASGVVSIKPAQFTARCDSGYLVMDSANSRSQSRNGILVDQKKRLIPCQ